MREPVVSGGPPETVCAALPEWNIGVAFGEPPNAAGRRPALPGRRSQWCTWWGWKRIHSVFI